MRLLAPAGVEGPVKALLGSQLDRLLDIWNLLRTSPPARAPEVAFFFFFLQLLLGAWASIREEVEGKETFVLEPKAGFFSPFRALLRCRLLSTPCLTTLALCPCSFSSRPLLRPPA